ncbi:hypothetical protein OFB58_25470, partial [Escherichia coli]|nr:hypothetical protein [Escherichia coli]
ADPSFIGDYLASDFIIVVEFLLKKKKLIYIPIDIFTDLILICNNVTIIRFYIVRIEETIRTLSNKVNLVTINIKRINKGIIAIYAK